MLKSCRLLGGNEILVTAQRPNSPSPFGFDWDFNWDLAWGLSITILVFRL